MSCDPKRYPSTSWTIILEAQDPASLGTSQAMHNLISLYWRPVYWSIRRDWNHPPEEAQDLTQTYFTRFLERAMLQSVAREHGRFRSYVKATLRNFLLEDRRTQQTLKRGGGHRILALESLSDVEAEGPLDIDSPDRQFERELMRSILHKALARFDELCRRDGRPEEADLFRAYYLEEGDTRRRYEDLVNSFGLSLHEVKNRLARARKLFRDLVLRFLRDELSSDEDLVREAREVFGG